MRHDRTGPGVQKGYTPTPEQVAQRLENLARGRARQKPRQKEDLAQLAIDVTGMSLDELRKRISARSLMVAVYHVAGLSVGEIARIIGYATADVARRTLARPDVAALIDRIKAAQLQRVIDGEFGVQAAAKAAAPKIAKRIIEKAGGIEDRDGRPVGMAHRDADALRAGETALRLSGDLTERRENVHVHFMEEMSEHELAGLAEHGVWPEKYQHILGTLGLDEPQPPAIDVTPRKQASR
jgi:hypothetical protein